VFKTVGPRFLILILGTSKNNKVKNPGNKEPAEAWEYTFLQEIHKLAMLCLWEHCHHEA
jgi:hypothetical protein